MKSSMLPDGRLPQDRRQTDTAANRLAARRAIEEFEFSEWGRDPRFLPGWFLIPGFAIASLMAILLIALA